jgi:hypothetical protein
MDNSGLAKEIERQCALRNKAAPEVHGILFVGAAETGNEIIVPADNGAFERIAGTLVDSRFRFAS